MEIIDTIGFDNTYIELKLAGRIFNITSDPPVEIYWKLINSVQKNKGQLQDINRLKDYIIGFILDSHYSQLSFIKKIGKYFDKRFLKKNIGMASLNIFINKYFEIINKSGVLKNVQSPQTKKK
ncbi:MAG: hypothetical protein PHW73_01300 [Atribacterota bacterium]|nr:hypothetical protein [Atribacterota bacterium]